MRFIETAALFIENDELTELGIETNTEGEWVPFCFDLDEVESFNVYLDNVSTTLRFKSSAEITIAMFYKKFKTYYIND